MSSTEGSPNTNSTFEGSTPADLYVDVQSEKFTVDGVEGMWYSAVASRDMLGIKKGSKDVEYHFFTNGRNYSFVLIQDISQKDAITDFDLMVKDTLKFSN